MTFSCFFISFTRWARIKSTLLHWSKRLWSGRTPSVPSDVSNHTSQYPPPSQNRVGSHLPEETDKLNPCLYLMPSPCLFAHRFSALGWKGLCHLFFCSSIQLPGSVLYSSHLASPQACDSTPDALEEIGASKTAVTSPLVFSGGDKLSGSVHHPPIPECKSQEVSCLRKTINAKYQDYRLPHLQISPAHICLSQQFMPSQCQAVQICHLFLKWADAWFLAPLAVCCKSRNHQKSSCHREGWNIYLPLSSAEWRHMSSFQWTGNTRFKSFFFPICLEGFASLFWDARHNRLSMVQVTKTNHPNNGYVTITQWFPNTGELVSLGDTWQCLEKFLIVTRLEWGFYWRLVGRGQGHC